MIAKDYYDAGLAILPLKVDGSKASKIKWGSINEHGVRLPWFQISSHFVSRGKLSGIGIVCGKASDNLEVIDHDTDYLYPEWAALVDSQCPGLLGRLPIIATPSGGRHVYYRCDDIEAGQHLAQDADGGVLIETRGQGNYVVAPDSPPETHRLGLPYVVVRGDLCSVPTVTVAERQVMLDAARTFNQFVRPTPEPRQEKQPKADLDSHKSGNQKRIALPMDRNEMRPGDLFNAEVSWDDVLEPMGWECVKQKGNVRYWRKPDATKGSHASTNADGTDRMYVHSTSVMPLEGNRYYSKFAVFAFLGSNGDFALATRKAAKIFNI